MSKKIIHELDLDDLIALASGAKPSEVADKLTDASKFIYDMKLKHGDTKIPAEVVYYTYQEWKGWDKPRQSKFMFTRDFNKYFEPSRSTNGMVYFLNEKPFDLSTEAYWDMKRRQRAAKSQKKKNTKKSSQEPEPKS